MSHAVHQASRVELARQRLMDSARTLGMMAEQQQITALRDEEQRIRDRLDHEPEHDLLADAIGLLTRMCPDSSCGLLLPDPDARTLRVVAASGWTRLFAAWHETLPCSAERWPLGATANTGAAIVIDRIGAARTWPEWRACTLAQGWRSCISLPIHAEGGEILGALVVYSHAGTPPPASDLRVVEQVARLVAFIMNHDRSQEPHRDPQGPA